MVAFPIGKINPVDRHAKTPEIARIRSVSDLGALVRAVRRESGAAQAIAAGLAGVGTRFLGELERGKPNLRLGLVMDVLDRLGLEVWIARRGWRPPEP